MLDSVGKPTSQFTIAVRPSAPIDSNVISFDTNATEDKRVENDLDIRMSIFDSGDRLRKFLERLVDGD